MSSLLTPSHPAFAVPRDTARSYLTWARRLAQLEAVVLFFATCSLVTAPTGGQANGVAVAIVSLAMGFLYLALGYYVGQGNPRAAIALLGLSIVRAVMAFLPGQTNLGAVVAPLLLADLFLFTQASRAAISLAKRVPVNPFTTEKASNLAQKPVVPTPVLATPVVATPVLSFPRPETALPIPAGTFKWPRPWEDNPTVDPPSVDHPSVNPRFTFDFVVASILLVVSMAGLADSFGPKWRGDGIAALGGLMGLAVTAFHLPMAAILFAAARNSEKKKSWTRTARVVVYFFLVSELLQLIETAVKLAFA
ncbi:MAG: hypothetical protein ACJ8AK_16600 [Gemmatimonadaceae bacterium]